MMTVIQTTTAAPSRRLARRGWIARSSLQAMAVMLATPALAQAGPAAPPAAPPVVQDGQGGTGKLVTNRLPGSPVVQAPGSTVGSDTRQTVYTNYQTTGGAGSGGGAGLGGVFFVDQGASLTLNNVSFLGNSATGGEGGGFGKSNVSPFQVAVNASGADATSSKVVLPTFQYGTLANNDPRSQGVLVNALTLESFTLKTADPSLVVGATAYLGNIATRADQQQPANAAPSATITAIISNADGSTTYRVAQSYPGANGQQVGAYIVPADWQSTFKLGDPATGFYGEDNTSGSPRASGNIYIPPSQIFPGTGLCGRDQGGPQVCGTISDIKYGSGANIVGFTLVAPQGSAYANTVSAPLFNSVEVPRFEVKNQVGFVVTPLGPRLPFQVGMLVFGDNVPAGTTIVAINEQTGAITLSNAVDLLALRSFRAAFDPLSNDVANNRAIIKLNSTDNLAVGQVISGTGILAGTTITAIDATAKTITISNAVNADGLKAVTNGGFQITTSPVVSVGNIDDPSRGNFAIIPFNADLRVGTILQGIPGLENAKITDKVGDRVYYTIDPTLSTLVKGGSLNGLTTISAGNGGNGINGSPFNAIFGDGEGTDGTNARNGDTSVRDGNNTAGGNGGVGGAGSFGAPINAQLILANVTAATTLGVTIAKVVIEAGGVLTIPAAIATSLDIGLNVVDLANSIIQLTGWTVELGLGQRGLGGGGGSGGAGGDGGVFLGGGAGGDGGRGGNGALPITDGGAGGDGGVGGKGGFGAGGGSGGQGGLGGAGGRSDNGGDGSGGQGGFGGGVGSSGYAGGGGGGSGYGGAIFVRSGGQLNITGNAVFDGNAVYGGSSNDGGEAGQAAGADLFMMKGATVGLRPGIGHTITFTGGIADDSAASIEGAAIASGNGAGLTIGGGGLVQFFGENTYTGTTILTGATLQADQGVGLHANSRLLFQGAGTISSPGSISEVNAPVLLTSGLFTRSVGVTPASVAWAGSGGFAATASGLTVNLGQRNGQGTNLIWGVNSFMAPITVGGGSVPSTLVFGSAAPDATGEVRFLNAINLNGNAGRIAVWDNAESDTDRAVMSGAITGGSLIVNDANYAGSLYLTGQNALTGIAVQNGLVSTLDGTTIGRLMAPAGGNVLVSGGTLLLGGAEKLLGVMVGAPATLDARGAITAGTVFNEGIIRLGASSTTGSIVNSGTFTAAGTLGTGTIINSGGLTATGRATTGDIANEVAGTISFAGGVNAGTITNAGRITLGGPSTATTIVNAVTGGTPASFASYAGLTATNVLNQGNWTLSGDLTAAGVVANDGNFTVVGTVAGGSETAATRTITTANFTGAAAGRIDLGATGNTLVINQSGTNSYAGTMSGAGNLVVGGGGSLTLGGVLSQTGGLRVASGTATLTAADTFTGRSVVDAGALLSLTGQGNIAASAGVTANGTFDIAAIAAAGTAIRSLDGGGNVQLGAKRLALIAAADRFDGVIAGTGGLDLLGGTQALGGVSTYTGTTTVANAATLSLAGAGSIAGSVGVLANGTLNIAGANAGAMIGSLAGSGAVVLGGQALTLTRANDRFDGVISGSGGVTLAGGTEVLAGANTYTGRTTVAQNALLALAGNGAIAASALDLAGTFDISTTTTGAAIASLAGTGAVQLGGKTLTLTAAADRFDGAIGGTGSLTLVSGSETLGGVSVYTGRTTIGAGTTLSLVGGGSIAASSGLANAGLFSIAGTDAGASITALSGDGRVALGARTLTLTAGSGRYDGVIDGSGGLAIAGGATTLTAAQTYTGRTTVAAGTGLALSGNGSLAGSTTVAVNGVLDLTGAARAELRSLSGSGAVAIGGNTLRLTAANDRFDGMIGGTGGLTIAQGTATLGGVAGFTGRTTIDAPATLALAGAGSIASSAGVTIAGTLDLSATTGATMFQQVDGAGNIALGAGRLAIAAASGTFAGVITGPGSLAVLGGQMALTGTSNYAGGTEVRNARLTIGSDRSLGATGGPLALENATLVFATATTSARTTTLTGIDVIDTGANAVTLGGAIGGTGALTATGGGSLTLRGANTYAGGTSVTGNTTLRVVNDAALGAVTGSLLLQGGTLQALGDFATARNVRIAGSGRIDANGFSVALNGMIFGQSGTDYVAIAAGNFRLTGVLDVNPATTGFTVLQGATLRGVGSFARAVTVAGTLAPGNSPGTMTFNAPVTIAPTGTLSIDIDGTGTGTGAGNYSRVVLTGNNAFTAGGTLSPVLRGITGSATNTFVPTLGQTFAVVQTNVPVIGNFASVLQPTAGLAAGTRLDVFYNNHVTLVVTPSAYSDLGALFGGNTVLTPNQAAVGAGIDALRGTPGTRTSAEINTLLGSIYALRTGAEVAALETALGGEIYTDAMRAAAARTNGFGQLVDTQADLGTRGGGQLWLTSLARQYDLGSSTDRTTYGFAGGGGVKLGGNGLIGIAAGYDKGRLTRQGSGDRTEIEMVHLTGYAAWTAARLFARAQAGATRTDIDVTRAIPQLGYSASGSGSRWGFAGAAEVGYTAGTNGWLFQPSLGVRTARIRLGDLTETGAGPVSLAIDDAGFDEVQGLANARIGRTVDLRGGGVLRPVIDIGYQRELDDNRASISARFAGAPGTPMTFTSVANGRDALRVGLGVSLATQSGLSVTLRGDLDTQRNIESRSIFAGLGWRW